MCFLFKSKISSKKGETFLLQTDLSRSNSVIPRSIQWKERNISDEWVLEGVVQPNPTKPHEPLEPNTRLKHIEQFHDGKVKLSFIRNHHENIDDDTCESSSLPEIIDLGRVSQLAQYFSRMENCPNFQPRFSNSNIPNSVLRNVDFRTQIPKPIIPLKRKKKLIFKPFQISSSSVKTYQETNKEFICALQSQLSKIDIGENSMPHESNIPDTPTSKAQINTLANESYASQIPTIEQSRFNSSSVYDWNIDGISEYNILNFLQNMTMAANAYRTQVGNEDRTVAEILVAGFSCQLKGWWDNYLNNQQRSEILDADNFGNPQQDPVATLVIAITLHFIGDPSVLRDKNAELLSNLKCKKFKKVTNKIRDSTGTQIIDYDDFTYGELISIVQQEGLKICQDLKLQKHLKWELKITKVELGSFCRQFETDPSKNSKSCIGNCNIYSKRNKTPKSFYKHLTCFECNKKGHNSKFCCFNRKIQELGLGEELSSKISNLLLDHSSSAGNASDSSLSSEKTLQVDELKNTSSGSESDENKINVLTKDQEFQIEPSKPNNPTSSKSSYDLTTILNKRKKDVWACSKMLSSRNTRKLSAANNFKLRITYKAEASVLKDNIFIKTAFVLTDDIYQN
ncbi:hypothetical protein EUTSA_v10002268mg, partial [Eutrema salsugineum]